MYPDSTLDPASNLYVKGTSLSLSPPLNVNLKLILTNFHFCIRSLDPLTWCLSCFNPFLTVGEKNLHSLYRTYPSLLLPLSLIPHPSIVPWSYYVNFHYRDGSRLFSSKILFIIRQLWTTSLSWLARAVFSAFQLAFWIVKQIARLTFITDIHRVLCDVQIQ